MKGVLQCGAGEDLLFLHGYLASKESFYPQLSYFSKFYRVTALDFPGMGEGEALPAAWSVDDYASWTARRMGELGIASPRVIAHSFGGRVAIKLLARGRVKSAVLAGCAGVVPKRKAGYHVKVWAYHVAKKVAPRFAERRFGSKEYRTLSPLMRESYKKIVNEDLRAEAGRIRQPVLFITGEGDRATPPSSAKILSSCIGGSRVLILKGCGHFVHLDDALAFNLAAEEFFNDL